MKEVTCSTITRAVAQLCVKANLFLPDDVRKAMEQAASDEKSPVGREVIGDLLKNLDAAAELHVPVCQDTGMAVVFLEIGQDVHITGGNLTDAVNEGVRQGTKLGCLRCSVVGDPLIKRVNTGDNTPAVIHVSITNGESLTITVSPKGFGSENMSAMKMFTPAATRGDLIGFVADTVKNAGSRPCPPMVVGVGIGGDFEYCAYLAKKALIRPLGAPNPLKDYRKMEEDMLRAVNDSGIGPQGFGGTVTALAVNIETYATHIAGLPVAVNMGCHVTRHMSVTI